MLRIVAAFCFALACVLLAVRLVREKSEVTKGKSNTMMGYLAVVFQFAGLMFLLAASI